MNKFIETFRYYLLSSLSFLISFIGIVGMRMITIVVGFGIALKLEKYIGKVGLTVGWIVSLVIFGIIMIGLERFFPYLEKLDNHAKPYKRYHFTEKYGANYPKPNPEDFGISQDEFNEYNGRFQFELIKIFLPYGVWIVACIYSLQTKLSGNQGVFLIGGSAAAGILLNYLFEYWNKRISKRHRHYEKISKYEQSVNIYCSILRENLNI